MFKKVFSVLLLATVFTFFPTKQLNASDIPHPSELDHGYTLGKYHMAGAICQEPEPHYELIHALANEDIAKIRDMITNPLNYGCVVIQDENQRPVVYFHDYLDWGFMGDLYYIIFEISFDENLDNFTGYVLVAIPREMAEQFYKRNEL